MIPPDIAGFAILVAVAVLRLAKGLQQASGR